MEYIASNYKYKMAIIFKDKARELNQNESYFGNHNKDRLMEDTSHYINKWPLNFHLDGIFLNQIIDHEIS